MSNQIHRLDDEAYQVQTTTRRVLRERQRIQTELRRTRELRKVQTELNEATLLASLLSNNNPETRAKYHSKL